MTKGDLSLQTGLPQAAMFPFTGVLQYHPHTPTSGRVGGKGECGLLVSFWVFFFPCEVGMDVGEVGNGELCVLGWGGGHLEAVQHQ